MFNRGIVLEIDGANLTAFARELVVISMFYLVVRRLGAAFDECLSGHTGASHSERTIDTCLGESNSVNNVLHPLLYLRPMRINLQHNFNKITSKPWAA